MLNGGIYGIWTVTLSKFVPWSSSFSRRSLPKETFYQCISMILYDFLKWLSLTVDRWQQIFRSLIFSTVNSRESVSKPDITLITCTGSFRVHCNFYFHIWISPRAGDGNFKLNFFPSGLVGHIMNDRKLASPFSFSVNWSPENVLPQSTRIFFLDQFW
jgi:hypothetical protein